MTNRSTAVGLVAIACGLALPTIAQASTAPPTSAPADSTAAEPVDLTEVCPDPLVIQTNWFPESEYGAVYGLLGDDYEVDTDNKVVTGSLVSSGQDTGIDVEIRAGGPVITGGVSGVMYTDDSVSFGFGTTDGQILRWADTPLLSIVAPLDIDPQMIMWDPERYPDVATIADLGEAGVTVNVFDGQTFTEFLVATGQLDEAQVDPSYDASPARFIAEDGAIAQQGYASSEPFLYEHVYEEWGRPVAYQTLYDAGFQPYTATLAIRPDDLESLRPCLELFVPVVQQSTVDFVTDPARTNTAIVDIVEQYDTFWTYTPELAEFSVQTQVELGLAGNGPDETIGNMDEARIADVLEQMRDAGQDVPEGLVASDIVTNEFIDPEIGLDS